MFGHACTHTHMHTVGMNQGQQCPGGGAERQSSSAAVRGETGEDASVLYSREDLVDG